MLAFSARARQYTAGSSLIIFTLFHHRSVHLEQMRHWLVKQEPEDYSWSDLMEDGKVSWTGVRNFQARNYLREMKQGDQVLFYHSVTEKRIVGIARIQKQAYPDPTATEGDWSCVDLTPVKTLKHSVTLEAIKADAILRELPLVKQSRLSVMPVTPGQFKRVKQLGAKPG